MTDADVPPDVPGPSHGPFDYSVAADGGQPSRDERTWAAVAHGVGVGSSILFPVVVSLVIYMAKKDESSFVADQAREALNFQITVVLLTMVAVASLFCLVGVALLPIVALTSLVFSVIAAIKAHEGVRYRYPFALRLI